VIVMPLSTDLSRRSFLASASASILAGVPRRAGAEDPARLIDTDTWIRQQADKAPLAMQVRGSSAAECRKWQDEFAAKLRSLLGPHLPPAKWKTIVRNAVDLKDHRREELLLEAEGHPPLPVYLLLPQRKSDKPGPAVVALHGHGPHGYHPVAGHDDLDGVAAAIKSSNYDYGRQLVRRGYVVAVPCLTPFGPRQGKRDTASKQDLCAVTFVRMQLLGKLLMAENLRDCLWAVELLARHPRVDSKRLGCVGLSYGGRMTMLTAALEPRIRAAVISGALNVMQERIAGRYSCGAQVIPRLLEYGDVPEIGALIAPRLAIWEVGSRDGLIVPRWADEALRRMKIAYKALGASDRLLVDRFDGGHRWNGELAYPQLEKALESRL
jgi:dienelactone hydrolase